MFRGFSPQEIQQFSSYLERIYKNLSVDKVDPEEMHSVLDRGTEKNKEE